MTSSRSGIGRYRVLFIGFVLVIGGVAALGCFLTAAGRHSTAGAIGLGIATALLLLTGFAILRVSARRRGGLLSAKPTRAERRVYGRMYRGPRRSAH
jgi:ribosomal protein S9